MGPVFVEIFVKSRQWEECWSKGLYLCLRREAPKQRRKASKGKEEKERQKEIKVEVKEENEFQEDEEPPRK